MLEENADSTAKYKAIHGVVLRIPAGKVASYGQVAAMAGLPGRARLAGKALGTTVNQRKIPWHRVIRSDGRIAFAQDNSHFYTQVSLLQKEGVIVTNGRVSMKRYQWDAYF